MKFFILLFGEIVQLQLQGHPIQNFQVPNRETINFFMQYRPKLFGIWQGWTF